jgi:GT2 family glycosyltransferase
VAEHLGARVLRTSSHSGPAAARNVGARAALGDVLFFVDADVVVHDNMVARVVQTFADEPDLAAVFGSYDVRPVAPGAVSQYRNLLHHFVHQHGNHNASTFWAGCGAVRRSVFLAAGGFDERRFPDPSIEDIEFGYRLRADGHRIVLDKELLGTHLKKWTLLSMIWTDLRFRALPWSRLMLERRMVPDDLNLKRDQRISVGLVAMAGMLLALSFWHVAFLAASAAAIAAVVITNREVYGFFRRRHGLRFAATCVPLHLVYFMCSGLGYVWGRLAFEVHRREMQM